MNPSTTQNNALHLLPLLLLLTPPTLHATCYPSIRSTPDTQFHLNPDANLVTDTTTQRQWQRRTIGQHWNGTTCAGRPLRLTYAEAQAQLADHPGWRLPTAAELHSLIERACFYPAINRTQFPATPPSLFWSRSAGDGEASQIAIDFHNAMEHPGYPQSQHAYLRLVR